jgi:uncharacterized membrane protein
MEWGVRPILLGYPGWAFNFGFLYRQRELDIYTMYAGGSETESLLKKYGVSYVVIGPSERYNRNMKVNEAYFTKYPLILHYNNMKVYDVRGLTGGR